MASTVESAIILPKETARALKPGWWPERLASVASTAGVLWSILDNFHVRGWEVTGSDFKTLYASAWCFNRGLDAYDFHNLARVFSRGGVAQPHTWFGHAPVYPPLTLALLAPWTLLPMWIAVYAWVILSGLALAGAAAALARFAGQVYGLGRMWRTALLVAMVASPLAGFGLALGNVSVVVASLCVLVVVRVEGGRVWPRAFGLALALLLKPHMALWVMFALLLVRSGRSIATKACLSGGGMAAALYLYAVTRTGWGADFGNFFAMLHRETAGGSMRAANHELMEVPSQIISLDSMLGYGGGHWSRAASLAVLVGLTAALVWASLRIRGRGNELLAVSAWCALGLIATYHRAADGTLLLMLLPVLALRWKACWWNGWAWTVFGLMAAASVGLDFVTMVPMVAHPAFGKVEVFLLYRQAAMASALLAGLLIWAVVQSAMRPTSLMGSEVGRP